MKKYSVFSLLRNAISYNRNWQQAWRSPDPQRHYDVIIVGGGGHGLATAYYLAKEHGIGNIAVLEKGWIGGGNTGRNTTIVRSNYLWTEAALLYEKSLKLWEGLSQDLNYNVMFSQRGVYNLAHSLQDIRDIERRVSANRLNGIDAEFVTPAQIKNAIPIINTSPDARHFLAIKSSAKPNNHKFIQEVGDSSRPTTYPGWLHPVADYGRIIDIRPRP